MNSTPERGFYLATLPEPVVLLGQRLQPLSIGHLTILQRFDCAFVTEGKVATLNDLAFAVFICSQTWEEAKASLLDDALGSKLKRWGKQVGAFKFESKRDAFLQYLIDGSRGPKVNPGEHEGRLPGAPFLQRVRMVLQGRLNYTYSEAMNCPWGLAQWEYFAFWEMEGAVKLYSQEDAAVAARVEELRAKLAAESGWTLLPGRN